MIFFSYDCGVCGFSWNCGLNSERVIGKRCYFNTGLVNLHLTSNMISRIPR